jgi:hypothetical protein
VLAPARPGATSADPDVRRILALRSRDRRAILDVLNGTEEIASPLMPHHQPARMGPGRRARPTRAPDHRRAHVGELTDALLDPISRSRFGAGSRALLGLRLAAGR